MKSTLQWPLVAGIAFGLGMAVDRGLTHRSLDSEESITARSEDEPQNGGSILDPAPVKKDASSAGAKRPSNKPRSTGGVLSVEEILELMGSPGNQRMSTTVALYQRLSAMSSNDLRSLAEGLEGAPQDHRMHGARHQVFSAWTETDPEAAWEFAQKAKSQQTRQQLYSMVFAAMAQEDPARAKEMLADIWDPQLRASAVQGFVGTDLMDTDPDLVIKMLGEGNDLTGGGWQYSSAFSVWAQKDPLAASEALKKLPLRSQMGAASGIGRTWCTKDPDAAFAWATQLKNSQTRQNAISGVISALTFQDPQKAIDFYDSLSKGTDKRQALQSIAQGYFQADSDSALEWIQGLSLTDRVKALEGSMSQIARNDPEAAAKLFAEIAMSNNMSHQAQQIAGQLAQKGTDKAMEWIDTLPSGQTKMHAISGLIQTWGATDPKAAAEYLEDFGMTQSNAHMASSLVSQWAATDREAAMDWVLSQENSSVQRDLISNVVSQLSSNDPQAAMEIIETLEDPSAKKSATQNFLRNLGSQDPDMALQWIEKQGGDEKASNVASLISGMAHNDHHRAAEIYQDYLPSLTE
jgi:hypothetical protein